MFELTKQTATLANFNARTERHGDRKQPAADLKIVMTGSQDLLDLFDGSLREVLFKPSDAKVDTQVANLFGETPPLTDLRYPKLGPVRWLQEFTACDVVIDWGIDDTSSIRLGPCDVDNFTVEPLDGGSVVITFRIAGHPTAQDAGKLYELQQCEITLTISPPAQADLIGEAA